MAINDISINVPFGNLDTFYEKCVYSNEAIPNEYVDDYKGTVDFHRALKEYFGDLPTEETANYIFGINTFTDFSDDPEPTIAWDGTKLVELRGDFDSLPMYKRVFNGRIFLTEETDKYKLFTLELNPNCTFRRNYIFTDNLPDSKNAKYKITLVPADKTKAGEQLYHIALNYKVKDVNLLSMYIPKKKLMPKEPLNLSFMDENKFENIQIVDLDQYNELNPYKPEYTADVILSVAGLGMVGYFSVTKSFVDSLNLDFNKAYTKEELLATGIKSFVLHIDK